MISLRYHAVSIAAVFLALALGVLLGAGGVSDRLLSAMTDEADDLAGQVQTLTVERDELASAQRAAEEFAQRIGPAAVRGLLEGRSVALVTAQADPADREAVLALIGTTGAVLTGEVALTPAVGDPSRADQLRELTATLLPAGAQLPAASDTGSLAGGLLGGVLLGPGAGTELAEPVLAGLAAAGFVTPGPPPAPAELVLVLTGGAVEGVDGTEAAAVTARLAAQLDRSGSGAVLAGRAGSTEATGAVGVARADPGITAGLSTVDDVQTGSGRVSAVLALGEQLDGRAGRYGTDVTAADGAAPTA
ncbi:MAG TPA: copper transporter [Pseudonocardia sp.]|nr:copper transporter [Pseudonocardia sp.]